MTRTYLILGAALTVLVTGGTVEAQNVLRCTDAQGQTVYSSTWLPNMICRSRPLEARPVAPPTDEQAREYEANAARAAAARVQGIEDVARARAQQAAAQAAKRQRTLAGCAAYKEEDPLDLIHLDRVQLAFCEAVWAQEAAELLKAE